MSEGLKIYFCGSIRGGRKYEDMYKHLVQILKGYGRVLTEKVADDKLREAEGRRFSMLYRGNLQTWSMNGLLFKNPYYDIKTLTLKLRNRS